MKGTRDFHKNIEIARTGIVVIVLHLYDNPRPGRGPSLAETVHIRKLNEDKLYVHDVFQFLDWSKVSFYLFYARSCSCSIMLNKTRVSLPALTPDCLCPACLTSWSVTLHLNRTIPNILPLCKVTIPGSLHPLQGPQWAKTAYIGFKPITKVFTEPF